MSHKSSNTVSGTQNFHQHRKMSTLKCWTLIYSHTKKVIFVIIFLPYHRHPSTPSYDFNWKGRGLMQLSRIYVLCLAHEIWAIKSFSLLAQFYGCEEVVKILWNFNSSIQKTALRILLLKSAQSWEMIFNNILQISSGEEKMLNNLCSSLAATTT